VTRSSTLPHYREASSFVQKYIGRVKEQGRTERRHSSFYIGLYGQTWVNFMEPCEDLVSELMRLCRNKWKYYQRGLRARTS
jgi:hypothetical protein